MAELRIATYNSHGLGVGRLDLIKYLCECNDIVLIQEHWLFNSEMHKFHDNITDITCYGSSGMNDNELLVGRPYGGTAILLRKSLNYEIMPLDFKSNACVASA